MVIAETKTVPRSWEISLLWIGANVLSIFGGILLGAFLNEVLWRPDVPSEVVGFITNPIQRAIVIGLSIGVIKGLLEWLILHRYEMKWKGWFPTSVFAWAVGITVAVGLSETRPDLGINELLGGITIGLSQWIILRKYLPKAYWWVIATTIGSFAVFSYVPLGYTFLMMLESFIAFIVTGLFMGLMTGTTLSWLLSLSSLKEQ
jgi:hypothetical protein